MVKSWLRRLHCGSTHDARSVIWTMLHCCPWNAAGSPMLKMCGVSTLMYLNPFLGQRTFFTLADNFTNLLMKHTDFQPLYMNPKEGGMPVRLLNYKIDRSLFTFTCYSYLDIEEVTPELAEIGSMFYKPESHQPGAVAPARRGGYFLIIEACDWLWNKIMCAPGFNGFPNCGDETPYPIPHLSAKHTRNSSIT